MDETCYTRDEKTFFQAHKDDNAILEPGRP